MAKFKEMTWDEFDRICKSIESTTTALLEAASEPSAVRIKKAKKDYNYFVKTYFAKYAKVDCAPWHIDLADEAMKDPSFKGLVEGHRGSAKSIHATLLLPLWLKINGEMKCMVLTGETEQKAKRLMATLQAELKSNRLFITDFGKQEFSGSWAEGEFVDAQGVAYFAIGLGQDPSGTRYEDNRPDYIVCDDLDNVKRCKNPRLVRESIEWVTETLMGCFDIGRERFLLVNSTKSKTSILEGMKSLMVYGKPASFLQMTDDEDEEEQSEFVSGNAWKFYKVPALDDKGNPTWPAKYTRVYWQRKRASSTLKAWLTNYQCENVTVGKEFKAEWIRFDDIPPLDEMDDLVVYCDPAWKNTPTACFKAVKFWGRKGTRLYKIKAFLRQTSVSSMVRFFYDLYESLELKDKNSPFKFNLKIAVNAKYYIEANMLQDMLMDEFAVEGENRGYQLPISGDTRSKPDKFSRIVAMAALYERGFIIYNKAEENDPDMQRSKEHLLAVEEGANVPLDGPDADEGALWYLQRSGRQKKAESRIGFRTHKNAY